MIPSLLYKQIFIWHIYIPMYAQPVCVHFVYFAHNYAQFTCVLFGLKKHFEFAGNIVMSAKQAYTRGFLSIYSKNLNHFY